jgi:hypothetical protein
MRQAEAEAGRTDFLAEPENGGTAAERIEGSETS